MRFWTFCARSSACWTRAGWLGAVRLRMLTPPPSRFPARGRRAEGPAYGPGAAVRPSWSCHGQRGALADLLGPMVQHHAYLARQALSCSAVNGTDLALAFVGQLVAEIQNRSSEVARIFPAVRSLVEIAGCGVTTMLTAETLKSAGPPASRRPRSSASLRLVPGGWTSGRPAPSPGPFLPTPRATSPAWYVPSGPSSTSSPLSLDSRTGRV